MSHYLLPCLLVHNRRRWASYQPSRLTQGSVRFGAVFHSPENSASQSAGSERRPRCVAMEECE
jgi:hypothetical protein